MPTFICVKDFTAFYMRNNKIELITALTDYNNNIPKEILLSTPIKLKGRHQKHIIFLLLSLYSFHEYNCNMYLTHIHISKYINVLYTHTSFDIYCQQRYNSDKHIFLIALTL